MDFNSILQEFFFKPILDSSVQGYNPVNTIVYGVILLLVSFYVLFPLLKKYKIVFSIKFFLALIPFILIGVTLRSLNSFGLFHKTINPLDFGFYTFTPGVWILTAFLTILGLIIARFVSKKIGKEFELMLGVIGFVFYTPLLLLYLFNFVNAFSFIASLVLIGLVSFIAFKIITLFKKSFFKEKLNLTALIGQVMDSTATFYAIQFCGFTEQHPVSEMILNTNPVLFIIVKIILITLIIHFIDKDVSNPEMNAFIKIFLSILGFATGLASVFKLGLIGC